VRVDVGDLDDILGGGGFSEFFNRIFGGMQDFETGQGPVSGTSGGRGRPAPRPTYEYETHISLQEAYQGATRLLEVDGRRLEVKIPPGARTGTKVRVADAITTGPQGQKGDLFLVIKVSDDPDYERKDNDLYVDVPVDLYTAVLGGEITVKTLSGDVVLTIPPGTQPGQTFRLAGRGMPYIKKPETHGDLLVRVKVGIPRNLTPQQREIFTQLRSSS
jgi:curved DNA-binding protein